MNPLIHNPSARELGLLFLKESNELSDRIVDVESEGKGHYGAYCEALEMGVGRKPLEIADVERWHGMIVEEDRENGFPIGDPALLTKRTSLVNLLDQVRDAFPRDGLKMPIIELVTLMGDIFTAFETLHPTGVTSGRIARLLINYIALRAKHPPLVFRKTEKERLHSITSSNLLARCYFADKIREDIFNRPKGEVWHSASPPSSNMTYLSPNVAGKITIQWHELERIAHTWRNNHDRGN